MTRSMLKFTALLEIMKQRKIYASDVCPFLDISEVMFSKYRAGKHEPKEALVNKLGIILNVSDVQLGFSPPWIHDILKTSPDYETVMEGIIREHFAKWIAGKQIAAGVVPSGRSGEAALSKSILQVPTVVNHGGAGK